MGMHCNRRCGTRLYKVVTGVLLVSVFGVIRPEILLDCRIQLFCLVGHHFPMNQRFDMNGKICIVYDIYTIDYIRFEDQFGIYKDISALLIHIFVHGKGLRNIVFAIVLIRLNPVNIVVATARYDIPAVKREVFPFFVYGRQLKLIVHTIFDVARG